jgi:hypothetical protein
MVTGAVAAENWEKYRKGFRLSGAGHFRGEFGYLRALKARSLWEAPAARLKRLREKGV